MNIRDEVIETVARCCDVDNIADYLEKNDELPPLEINSIIFMKIVVNLEIKFNFEFDADALDYKKYNSISKLSDYIEKKLTK